MSKILDDLIACGVPSDTILAVAKLMADAEVTHARRASNRDRMKSVRTRAHTRLHTETQPPQHILPPLSTKKEPKKVLPSMRKVPLPENFSLIESDVRYARERGWSDQKLNDELDRFRLHAQSNGRLQVDWHASWKKWVTSPYQTNGVNGHARPQRKTTGDVCDELIADIRAKMEGTADSRGGDEGRQKDDVGLFGVLPVQPRVPDDDSGNVVPISDGGSDRGLFARPRRS